MTYYINQDAQSSLQDGIEVILITIRNQNDLNHLAFQTARGPHAVVEWLLSELGRSTEIERVCGLSVSTDGAKVVVNLDLRQPGKQMEAWFLHPLTSEMEAALRIISGYLSLRSVSQEKFTDKYPPWWLPKTMVLVE